MKSSRWLSYCMVALLVASARAQEPQPSPSEPPLPTWKDEIAKNHLPYHQLTPNDFPINDTAHPKAAFWVAPFVQSYCHFISTISEGGVVYANVTDWTVFSGFDKNLSSRNSKLAVADMKNDLPYIQALFDIGELHARRLGALKAGELPSAQGRTAGEARAQLEDKIAALTQKRAWDAQKETEAFVKATDNGRNKKKVRELAAEIKKRLAEIPPGVPAPSPATP